MMTVPAGFSAHQIRSAQELEALWAESSVPPDYLYQRIQETCSAVHLAGLVAQKTVLQNYNPAIADSRQQGAIAAVYQLQNLLSDLTGYPDVSLPCTNSRMAIFACLSMIGKRHQMNKQQRSYIVLTKGMSQVAAVATQMGLQIVYSAPDDFLNVINEDCFAVVMPLPGLSNKMDFAQTLKPGLEQLQIPLCVDGSDQYLLTDKKSVEWLQADILHLDVAALCGLDKGVNALLANQDFADLLPVPVAGYADGAYQWCKLQQRPLSIGMLSDVTIDLYAVIHCLAYIRMQGFAEMGRQATQSMVIARYLKQQISGRGVQCQDIPESCACCIITLESNPEQSKSINLLKWKLNELPISLQWYSSENRVEIKLGNLHVLSFDQLQQLAEMFILRQND